MLTMYLYSVRKAYSGSCVYIHVHILYGSLPSLQIRNITLLHIVISFIPKCLVTTLLALIGHFSVNYAATINS